MRTGGAACPAPCSSTGASSGGVRSASLR
jgi:hypothetical protein